MATVDRWMAAAPSQVFAVLAQGWFYSDWVVGTSHVRAVDVGWPAAGSRLHHASGVWPVVVRDQTVVDSVSVEVQLVLTAKGWPLGEARVVIELDPVGTGTNVTLAETPVAGPGKWLNGPLLDRALAWRNVEALSRLKALVERHTHPAEEDDTFGSRSDDLTRQGSRVLIASPVRPETLWGIGDTAWHMTGASQRTVVRMSIDGKTQQERDEAANDALVNEDDEREAQELFTKTGEPVRDELGNASGAS